MLGLLVLLQVLSWSFQGGNLRALFGAPTRINDRYSRISERVNCLFIHTVSSIDFSVTLLIIKPSVNLPPTESLFWPLESEWLSADTFGVQRNTDVLCRIVFGIL